LLGIVAGRLVIAPRSKTTGGETAANTWLGHHPVAKGVAWMGRHSLLIYMLHQPIMLGALALLLGSSGAS
jgi:uncharacterized membrane protein